jgi:hypothetical protein
MEAKNSFSFLIPNNNLFSVCLYVRAHDEREIHNLKRVYDNLGVRRIGSKIKRSYGRGVDWDTSHGSDHLNLQNGHSEVMQHHSNFLPRASSAAISSYHQSLV